MTIPYNFKYLNIQPFLVDLQRSPDGKSQLISSVTQKGLHYFTPDGTLPSLESHVEVTLSRHGLLQVCLQRTNPFQQCMDDEIRDLRAIPIMAVRCQNRRLLLDTIADALLAYEDHLRTIEEGAQEMPEDMKEAWRKLGRAVAVFLELRKRKALSATSPRLALHKTTVEQAHQTLRQVIQTLTPDDYLKAAGVSKSSYRTTLCSRMRDAFLSHGGPPPQHFPEKAVYYATAMILSQFKVEAGSNIDTIVRRLRKRIERNKLSPSC